ncbi:glyoxylate/hydroxypyruvate reductase A [Telmatospirillum siberiense]|uniref:Glyoxylate/hydroxypyruvate reductase A n=2 Tax=Telmatospirillum siberiense TaxID=382514 RepID=A0A2N3PV37_9PROT|nr:glyoxylate/hydroxypyruvate reductase A [Telmatospirillum siberiense]
MWPAIPAPGSTFYVATWNPPEGFFHRLPEPKAVFALGAGVDRFLKRDDLPDSVPLIRLTDAGMARQMAEYALAGVLRFQRNLDLYEAQQTSGLWRPLPVRSSDETRVTVLGLGRIGGVVATTLSALGYKVSGWSRAGTDIPGVVCRSGVASLDTLLAQTDVLINVLPSTEETRGLLNRERLGRLPADAGIVNAARGDQLDADALVEFLDAGRLRGALLDVFPEEPLPEESRLWNHPKVRITPHVAAVTLLGPSVRQVVRNMRRFEEGQTVEGLVDRRRGY